MTIDHQPGKEINLWVVNDRLESYQDDLEIAVYDFNGEKVFSKEWSISIAPNIAKQVDVVLESDALGGLPPEEAVMVVRSKNDKTYENIYYFRDHKDVNFGETELKVAVNREKQELTISTDLLARMVTIEIDMEQLVMEDNFFDLLADETKVIKVEQAQGKEIPWESLRVTAINSVKTIVMEG